MNKNFDFNSKKYFILLGIICLLFLVVVINAFMYLPNDDNVKESISIQRAYSVNKPSNSNNTAEEEEVEKTQEVAEKGKTLDIKLPKSTDNVDFVEIDSPEAANAQSDLIADDNIKEETPEKKALSTIKEAEKYRASKQYIKALDEYQKVASLTSDRNIVSSSYEGIASLYAINRRYGTALSYAIKAYNLCPNSNREMLIARLYYKTGDIDKATQRVNNILRRDFSDDKW